MPIFDLAIFNQSFDFFIARSIWTHASKHQIQAMLDGFVKTASKGATFITSYQRATFFKREYKGPGWIGRSHESNTPGMVRHKLSWIQSECSSRGLVAEEIKENEYNFGDQTWIRIVHAMA